MTIRELLHIAAVVLLVLALASTFAAVSLRWEPLLTGGLLCWCAASAPWGRP